MLTINLKNLLVQELPRLRRFAHGLTGNKSDADDLVQSLVEKLLTKEPQNTPEVPWLLRVCKNLWIDKVRTQQNREQLLEQNFETAEPVSEGPQNDQMDQIMAAMMQLSQEQRQLVTLVIVEGFSYQEAADVLEIPVGTVMSRVARARSKLMSILATE